MNEAAYQKLRRWLIPALWPSFALAAVATGVLFSAFDPHELMPFGESAAGGRLAVYSIGFFVLWFYSALSIAIGMAFATLNDGAQSGTTPTNVDE